MEYVLLQAWQQYSVIYPALLFSCDTFRQSVIYFVGALSTMLNQQTADA